MTNIITADTDPSLAISASQGAPGDPVQIAAWDLARTLSHIDSELVALRAERDRVNAEIRKLVADRPGVASALRSIERTIEARGGAS